MYINLNKQLFNLASQAKERLESEGVLKKYKTKMEKATQASAVSVYNCTCKTGIHVVQINLRHRLITKLLQQRT